MYYNVICVIDHSNILMILCHMDDGLILNFPSLPMPGGHELFPLGFVGQF